MWKTWGILMFHRGQKTAPTTIAECKRRSGLLTTIDTRCHSTCIHGLIEKLQAIKFLVSFHQCLSVCICGKKISKLDLHPPHFFDHIVGLLDLESLVSGDRHHLFRQSPGDQLVGMMAAQQPAVGFFHLAVRS